MLFAVLCCCFLLSAATTFFEIVVYNYYRTTGNKNILVLPISFAALDPDKLSNSKERY
jgi:hypothetical protein